MSTLQEIAINNITCTYCGAEPKNQCHTKSGARSYYAHAGRTWPAQNAWWEGYNDGTLDWSQHILDTVKSGNWDWLIARAEREFKRIQSEQS